MMSQDVPRECINNTTTYCWHHGRLLMGTRRGTEGEAFWYVLSLCDSLVELLDMNLCLWLVCFL